MYKETNAQRAVKNVTEDGYDLGIIRFQTAYEQYFSTMLEEKELNSELISEFSFLLLMSEKHPLAKKDGISYDDLVPYTEIAHADPYVPSLSMATVRREEMYRDVLIYKKSYRLTDLDKDFITEVVKAKRLYLNGI